MPHISIFWNLSRNSDKISSKFRRKNAKFDAKNRKKFNSFFHSRKMLTILIESPIFLILMKFCRNFANMFKHDINTYQHFLEFVAKFRQTFIKITIENGKMLEILNKFI